MTSELESYKKRCLELEKKSENDEKRCLMLEVEVEDLKNKNNEFEGKVMKIREIVEVMDGEDEVEKSYELMTEMKVLECEKQKAESEVYKLKEKVNELMSRVYELESDMNEKVNQDVNVVSRFSSKVRKGLPFEADGCSSKKMAPSTPGVVAQTPFFGVIDISDEDVNYDETLENKNISYSSNHVAFDKTNLQDVDEADVDGLKFHCSNRSAKRKRAANIIPSDDETSDNETTYDDNVLISTLMKPLSSRSKIDSEDEVTEFASKRRLTRLRNLGSNNKQDTRGVDQNKTVSLQGNSSSEDEDANDEEDLDDFPSAKRIRTSNIIRSDDENSNIHDDMDGFKVCSSNSLSDDETCYDDNAPISTLMTRPNTRIKTDSEDDVKENATKQRRKRLRKIGSRNKQDKSDFDLTSSNEEHKHNGGVEEELDSEDDSLGGFIVPSSESGSDSACGSSDVGDEQEDESSNLQVVIEMLGRKKVWNRKWNLEGDMLADFGKDPELCMRAVCALNRQKSIDEDAPEEMRYEEMRNQKGRGFNLYDAPRGAKLAQFLTDGDYDGDLKKTVEELEQHDPNGIEVCTKFAYRYSKQLFRIYQNKEDPYFPSSSSQ